jgi:hypothetical protein
MLGIGIGSVQLSSGYSFLSDAVDGVGTPTTAADDLDICFQLLQQI